jgi:hypothetical protein
VAALYRRLAKRDQERRSVEPDFEHAVKTHRLMDAIARK